MIYLNGEWQPLSDAKVSVLDRGFLFADGVYEVVPVYSRHAFRLDEHLQRLQTSLDSIRLCNPLSTAEWRELVLQAIAGQDFDDQQVYLQVTRGCGPNRDFPFPAPTKPSTLIYPMPLITASAELKAQGVSAISREDYRWLRCDIKSLALLANVLLRNEALVIGCAETILIRDGYLSEGAASNIFVVKNGVLLCPPKSHLMLSGITYDVVLELAAANAIPVEVRPVSDAELRTADEIWMTSSTREILPITRLDDLPVGAGVSGPLAQRMDALYQSFKMNVLRQGGAS